MYYNIILFEKYLSKITPSTIEERVSRAILYSFSAPRNTEQCEIMQARTSSGTLETAVVFTSKNRRFTFIIQRLTYGFFFRSVHERAETYRVLIRIGRYRFTHRCNSFIDLPVEFEQTC